MREERKRDGEGPKFKFIRLKTQKNFITYKEKERVLHYSPHVIKYSCIAVGNLGWVHQKCKKGRRDLFEFDGVWKGAYGG